nr:MAG TPA: hypothetical protein [Caudoviricetes sp.]
MAISAGTCWCPWGFIGYSAATQWTGDSRVLSTHL